MRFSSIASGSKANCTFVECGSTRLLIDCGLSGRKAEERLSRLGIDPRTLDAILVTHEHCDHIHGVGTLSRRYRIPVIATVATSQHLKSLHGLETFRAGETVTVGDLSCRSFSIVHDAVDPVAFVLEGAGLKLGCVTDLGRVTTLVSEAVRGVNAIILESNHDQEMLRSCSYPWELKTRIASTFGHLCNEAAAQLLCDIMHPELFHVVLGHISENSNTPELALEASRKYLGGCPERLCGLQSLLCGTPYTESPLFTLDESGVTLQLAV